MAARSATLIAGAALFFIGCTTGRGQSGGGPGGGNGQCPAGCNSHCDANNVCLDCPPAMGTGCNGDAVYSCNTDGTFGAQVKACATSAGERCTAGSCLSACDVAAGSHSYVGCDYWPVTTLTGQLNPYFDFAVAVANPLNVGDVVQSPAANVTVTRNGKTVAKKTVAAGAVETIILPWVNELSQNNMGGMETSVLSKGGAYHLVSDLPVTVYQFSPLEFEKTKPADGSCTDPPGVDDGVHCHSFSNDATILLPTPTLRQDYIVIARESTAITVSNPFGGTQVDPSPGFFAVAATQDGTTVTVNYSANTQAGKGVPAQKPGAMASYTLNAGDVLQVASGMASSPCAMSSMDMMTGGPTTYCDLGPAYDLTGTHVTSDKPIEVFGGHSCTFVPFDKWACDHLESTIFPLETWGQKVIVVQTEPQVAMEPNVFRVVSGSDNNMISFDPPTVHAPVMLNTGQYVEFVAQGGFLATGTGRTAVGQYMVGENYFGSTSAGVGDPSLGMGMNIDQFRNNYDFLTPSTYTKSYVIIIAPMAANITLDTNMNFNSYTAIGGSGFGYKRVLIQPGAHHITGDQKFGIAVSGVASYTSYLYVGGQDLNDVTVQ